MKIRKILSLGLGIMVGNVVAERFVLKNAPDSPTGFVPVADGIGADEVARAACGVGAAFGVDWILSKVWK